MRKKILAVVLCLMTAVAFMPTFAFAADTPREADYGHKWAKDNKLSVEPTCTSIGYDVNKCKKAHCEEVKIDKIGFASHDYSELENMTPQEVFDLLVAKGIVNEKNYDDAIAEFNKVTSKISDLCYVEVNKCECGKYAVEEYGVDHLYWDGYALVYKENSSAEAEPQIANFVKHEIVDNTPACKEYATCNRCGREVKSPYYKPRTHKFGNWVDEGKTCEGYFIQARYCTVCGDKVDQKYLKASDGEEVTSPDYSKHNWGTPMTGVQAKKMFGDNAGEYVTVIGGKYYAPNTVVRAPDCTTDGKGKFVCADCGLTYETLNDEGEEMETHFEKIPATGHEITAKAVEATCWHGAYTYNGCKNCDLMKNLKWTSAPLGHEMEAKTLVEPTCEAPGVVYFQCKTCDCVDYFNIKHNEKAGTYKYNQLIFGAPVKTVEYGSTMKLGHKYGEASLYKEATCTTGTLTGYKCENCGHYAAHDPYHKMVEADDALGHKYEQVTVPATCGKAGYTAQKCSVCDGEKDILEVEAPIVAPGAKCDFTGDWKVLKEATIFEAGAQALTCAKCGAVNEHYAKIDKLAYKAPTVKAKKGKKVNVTVEAQADAVNYVIKAGSKTMGVTEAGTWTIKKAGKAGKKISVTITAYNAAGDKVVSAAKKVKIKK